MSLIQTSHKFLTLRPRIETKGSKLVIHNALLVSLLSLGSYSRTVTIDKGADRINLETRRFFFFIQRESVRISELSHLDYAFDSLGTDWGFTGNIFGRRDQVETFMISVVDKNDEKYLICKYSGEGAVSTGWMGTLFGGDEILDMAGIQEGESRMFVRALSKLLDLPLGKQYFDDSMMRNCPFCDRSISRAAQKCTYCAKPVEPMTIE